MKLTQTFFLIPTVAAGGYGNLMNDYDVQSVQAIFDNLRNGDSDHPIVQLTEFDPQNIEDTCRAMGIETEDALKNCLQNVVDSIALTDAEAGQIAQDKMDEFYKETDIIADAVAEALAAQQAELEAEEARKKAEELMRLVEESLADQAAAAEAAAAASNEDDNSGSTTADDTTDDSSTTDTTTDADTTADTTGDGDVTPVDTTQDSIDDALAEADELMRQAEELRRKAEEAALEATIAQEALETDEREWSEEVGEEEECEGEECPAPCEGEDCPEVAECEGDDCPEPCEGEDCPEACEGEDCPDEDVPDDCDPETHPDQFHCEFEYPHTHGQAMQQFKDFNDGTIEDLPPSTLEAEQSVVWTIVYWILFAAMWAFLVLPDIWDVVSFVLYVIYDFTSAWELFSEDEMSAWAYYAIGSLGGGLLHGGYMVASCAMTFVDMFVSDYVTTADTASISVNNPENMGAFFWGFLAINTINLAIPASKIIWMFMEEAEEEDGMFRMKQEQGQFNMEHEMYADIAKLAVIGLGYGVYIALPSIAHEIDPGKGLQGVMPGSGLFSKE